MSAHTLDHLGWVSRDGARLHAAFERLGFRLTPWATHSVPGPDGQRVTMGTGNRCAMLRDGYLELQAVWNAALPFNGVERYLDRYEGLHILALGMQDADAELARLRRAGMMLPAVNRLERPVNDSDKDGPFARFARLPLPDSPEGRLQLVQHLTPDLLWQDAWLDHPNKPIALEAAILVVERPARTASRLSRLPGRPVVPDKAGGFALPLAHGVVRMLPPEALGLVLPGVEPPAVPFIAGAVVRVADRGEAVRAILGDAARDVPGGLLAMAGGGAVLFTW